MNMSASVMLTNLPRDATQALADVESIDSGKGAGSFSAFWTTTDNSSHRSISASTVSSNLEKPSIQG
jgi:hypothetical protein